MMWGVQWNVAGASGASGRYARDAQAILHCGLERLAAAAAIVYH
jgi:hypothetical protein